ncbi:MAG: heme-binding protein [Candidatus Electrothrix sp. AR3]|nr:heme-binding protein [Candidatus Electrothrix sp. AR3]
MVPGFAGVLMLFTAFPGHAVELPTHSDLTKVLKDVVKENNGGFGLNMWATVVDRDGIVKAVVYSGKDRGDQWPGSRVISAQKANTANAFSLPSLSLSTANLFSAVQPGGSLYGLQHSNPVDVSAAYGGSSDTIGTDEDPMTGKKIGGVNVFGGGLALYNNDGKLLGALGVSGDSSCADHNIAWKVRDSLGLDFVPAGVSPNKNDNIVNDMTDGVSSGGWGHPTCSPEAAEIASGFSKKHPVGSKK